MSQLPRIVASQPLRVPLCITAMSPTIGDPMDRAEPAAAAERQVGGRSALRSAATHRPRRLGVGRGRHRLEGAPDPHALQQAQEEAGDRAQGGRDRQGQGGTVPGAGLGSEPDREPDQHAPSEHGSQAQAEGDPGQPGRAFLTPVSRPGRRGVLPHEAIVPERATRRARSRIVWLTCGDGRVGKVLRESLRGVLHAMVSRRTVTTTSSSYTDVVIHI